ncbi:thiol:disulfide interchange protein [Acetobacter sp. UBA5411]|uniref:thiol:disulfide interchange protein n=1 Tax=Acetobacter sp. UBA5411 TaxID=1945905 RepID=UPI0025B7B60F|nr:thiol:disulfide interchange protein [Acetobacter sp. UBA5411]
MRCLLAGALVAGTFLSVSPSFAQQAQCAAPDIRTPPATVPADATGDAFQRLVGNGTAVTWETPRFGLQVGIAKKTDQVMIFFTDPDHRYVLGGTVVPVPYQTLRTALTERAHDLAPELGLKGMFVQNGPHFQVLYATPDGQGAIAGTLWDAQGKNITRQQIRLIPGAVPSVRIDGGAMRASQPLADQIHGGDVGAADAPQVVMFIDPRCSFSVRAMRLLQPAVDRGRLRLKVVPLSLLDYEDAGASTRYALAMVGRPASSMVGDWMNDQLGAHLDQTSTTAKEALDQNMTVAHSLSLTGTPTFFWRKKDGTAGRLDGVPRDVDAFLAELGQ